MANGETAVAIVVLSFWNTWSIAVSAGGSWTQRIVHVRIVSISGGHSSAIFSVRGERFRIWVRVAGHGDDEPAAVPP